ncbi:MAG: hypothetical protein WCT03_07180 [Candidatus Obscuribacterales bacterium]|jgi:hypothetical protein
MSRELQENSEARSMQPVAIETRALMPNQQDMAAFWESLKLAGSTSSREQEMFSGGFSFSNVESLYGGSGATAEGDNKAAQKGIIGTVDHIGVVPMAEIKLEGDRQAATQPDNGALSNPEVQEVRTASAKQVETVKAANPNVSDGSVQNWASKTPAERLAYAEKTDQDGSFELVERKPSGQEVVIAARQMFAEVETKSQAEVDSRPIKDYGYDVKRVGDTQVIRSGVEYQVGKPPEVTEQSLFARIGSLPLDQQAQVIGAGIKAFSGEMSHQQFRIGVGAITGLGEGVVGLAQGAESLGNAIIGVAQFSRDMMENRPAAAETAGKACDSVSKLLTSGIKVYSAAEGYLESVGAATNVGDYGKALRDVAWLGQQINSRWEAMTPEEKTKLTTQLAVENLGGLAVGFGIGKIAKSEKIVETLEAMGTEVSAMGAGSREKAGQFISRMLDKLMPESMGVTPDGRLMPIPKDNIRNEANVLMSKADDSLGANAGKPKELQSGKPEKPPEVTKEALDNPEGLAKLAKKFGINMPPKDTYVFVGEKDALSADAAAKRLGISAEQLKSLDSTSLIAQKLERVPDYRDVFFNKHPGLIPIADRLVIHHGIPKWVLKEHPGLFSAVELNDPLVLRGIYRGVNDELHNSLMHKAWLKFQRTHPNPSRSNVLDMLESLDKKYGHLFAPTEGD